MTSLNLGGPPSPAGREERAADDSRTGDPRPGSRPPASGPGRRAAPPAQDSRAGRPPAGPRTPPRPIAGEGEPSGSGAPGRTPSPPVADSPFDPDAGLKARGAPSPPPTNPLRVLRTAWTRWWSRRYVRRGVAAGAVVVAATLVGLVTIDLGPAVRARAEQALGGYLDRDVSIGRVGIYLASGEFVVEDLTIGGLNPADRPFLVAGEITLSVVWSALLHGEFLADAVHMRDWRMLAESFPDGRQSFPAFVRQAGGAPDAGDPGEPAGVAGDPAPAAGVGPTRKRGGGSSPPCST